LNLGAAGWGAHDERGGRSDRGGKASQQRVLLKLCDQAVMSRALSILMEEAVKLRRGSEGRRDHPQR
jgi:hypothetical protein